MRNAELKRRTKKMIEYKRGDILREDAEALINTVNCVGIMGRGMRFSSRTPFRRT